MNILLETCPQMPPEGPYIQRICIKALIEHGIADGAIQRQIAHRARLLGNLTVDEVNDMLAKSANACEHLPQYIF